MSSNHSSKLFRPQQQPALVSATTATENILMGPLQAPQPHKPELLVLARALQKQKQTAYQSLAMLDMNFLGCLLTIFAGFNLPIQLLFPLSLLVAVVGYGLRLYDLSSNQYSLGKGLVLACVLCVVTLGAMRIVGPFHANIYCLFSLSLLSTTAIWAACRQNLSMPFAMANPNSGFYKLEQAIKRLADIAVSTAGLLCLLPVWIAVAIAIKLESPGSAIYSQKRVGQNERVFSFYKFRSMVADADKRLVQLKPAQATQVLFKQADDPRITPLGQFLRKTSIDEMPQLWNILMGDMSLVGPRPPILTEYAQMNPMHRRKFEALPGLTGLWQVMGRVHNERSFDQVAQYDVAYIENWCLYTDLSILLKTIPVVLKQRGAC